MSARGAYSRWGRVGGLTPLYRLREASGLTQREAAASLGWSERTYRTREGDEASTLSQRQVAGLRPIDGYYGRRFDEVVAALGWISPKAAKVEV